MLQLRPFRAAFNNLVCERSCRRRELFQSFLLFIHSFNSFYAALREGKSRKKRLENYPMVSEQNVAEICEFPCTWYIFIILISFFFLKPFFILFAFFKKTNLFIWAENKKFSPYKSFKTLSEGGGSKCEEVLWERIIQECCS